MIGVSIKIYWERADAWQAGEKDEERFHPAETAGWGAGLLARPSAQKAGARKSRAASLETTGVHPEVPCGTAKAVPRHKSEKCEADSKAV